MHGERGECMSLAVEVGQLAWLNREDPEGADSVREELARVNALLAANDVPEHAEPEELPPLDNRSVLTGFPYSLLHHLRRAYAHWRLDPDRPIRPCRPDEEASQDPAIEKVASLFDVHLINHSDSTDFYVPIPFTSVLIDDDDPDGTGGPVGSSYQFMEELVAVAPALGIRLEGGELADSEVERIAADVESESGLWIERSVWLTLFEAARLSIRHGTAIRFC